MRTMGSGLPLNSCHIAANATVPKLGQQWSRVPFAPTSPDFSENLVAMVLHFRDESAGRSRFLVPRPPNEQLQKHRRQVNSLLRQPVVRPSPIDLIGLRGDDPRCFELPQTVRQDVGGN